MKYKVGDLVQCQVETRPNGRRAILAKETELENPTTKATFQIIGININPPTYSVLIEEDDIIGWTIGEFRILYNDFPVVFRGKKFFDVTDEYILKKVK